MPVKKKISSMTFQASSLEESSDSESHHSEKQLKLSPFKNLGRVLPPVIKFEDDPDIAIK